MGNLSKYFSLPEMTVSNTAIKYRIDNTPTFVQRNNLVYLANNTLDLIRSLWGKPLHVNSGFRCYLLNREVGGAPNSMHTLGCAADVTTGTVEGNMALWKIIKANQSKIPFHKVIDEKSYTWLHISCKPNGKGNAKQFLHWRKDVSGVVHYDLD